MSNQTPLPNEQDQPASSQPPIPPSTDQDWRDMRRSAHEARWAERQAWHEQRRAWRRSTGTAWIGGVVLILLGVVFLLQNFGGIRFDNWWALFILLPAVGSFATAWNIYRRTGQWNRPARGALIGGFVLLLITATFLFNLNWGLVFPVLLIVLGVALLLNSMLPN